MIPLEQQQRLVKPDSGISRKQLNQQQALQQRQAAQLSQQSPAATYPRQNGIQFNAMNSETDQKPQLLPEENNFQQLRPTSSREQQQYPQMKQQYQQRFPQSGVQETNEEAYKRSNGNGQQHEQQIHEGNRPDDDISQSGMNRSQGFQQEYGVYPNGNRIENNSVMMNSSQIPIKEEEEQEYDGNVNENGNTNNTIENTVNEGLMELKVGFISSGLKKMEWGLQRCLLERSSEGEFRELFSVVVGSCNEVALELLNWNESSSALRLLQRCYIWTQSSSDFGYFPELRALTLNSLGCVYLRLSQLSESLSLFQEAQKIQQQATVAMTLTNLAAVSSRLGKHKKALEFARYALMESQHEFMISKDPQENTSTISNNNNNYGNFSSKSRLSKLTQLVRSYLNAGIGEEMAGSMESALRHFENAVSAAEEFLPADDQILQHVRQQFAGFSARYAHFKVHGGGAENLTQKENSSNHESVLTPQMLSATDSIGENNINNSNQQHYPHMQTVRRGDPAKDEQAKSSKLKKRPKKLKKKEKKTIISPYSQQLGFNYSNIASNVNSNSEYPLQVDSNSISQSARQQELLQYQQQQGYPGEQYSKGNAAVSINEQSQLVPHSRNSSNISLSLRRPLSAAPYSNYYINQQQQQQQQQQQKQHETQQYQSSYSHLHNQPLVINDFNSSAPSSSHNPKSAATTRSKRVFSPLSGKVKTKPVTTASTPQSQPYAGNHHILNSMVIRKTSTIPANNNSSSTPLSLTSATNSRTTPFLSYKNKQMIPFAFPGAIGTSPIDENPLYNVNSASRTSLLKSLKKQYSRVASNMESIERQLQQQEHSRSTAASTQPAFHFHDHNSSSSGNNHNHFHKTSNLSGSISEQIPQGGGTGDQGQLSEYFKGASLPRQQVKQKQRPAVISAVPGAASVYESLMQNKKSDRPFLIRNSKISQIAGGNNAVYLPMSLSQLSYAGSPHSIENGNNTSIGRNGRADQQQQQMYFRAQTLQNNNQNDRQQQMFSKGGKHYLNNNNSKTSYDLQLGQDSAEQQGQEYMNGSTNLKEVTYPDFQMGQSWKSTQNNMMMLNAYPPSASALPFAADILQENQLIQLNEIAASQAQNTYPNANSSIPPVQAQQDQPGIAKTQGQFGSLRFLFIESNLTVSIVFKPERNPNALLIHSVSVSDVMNSKERSEGRQLLVEFCAVITSKIYVNNIANCLSIVLPVVDSKGDGTVGGWSSGNQQNNNNNNASSNDRFIMQQQIQLQRIHRCLDIVLKNQSQSILLVAENSFNNSAEGTVIRSSHANQKIKDYMEFYEEEQQQPLRGVQQQVTAGKQQQQQQQKNLQMGQYVEEYEDDDQGAIRPLLNTVLMEKTNGKDDEELITPIMLDTAQIKALNNSRHKGQQNRRSVYQGEQIAEVEEADTLNNHNHKNNNQQSNNPSRKQLNNEDMSDDEDIIEDFEYDEDDDKFEQDLERAVQQTNNNKDSTKGYKNTDDQAEKYKKKNIPGTNKGSGSNKHKPQSSKVPKSSSGKVQQNLQIERARSAYHKKLDEDGSENDDDQGAGESKYGFASRVSSKSRQRLGDDKSESINQNDHRVLGLQEIESQLDIAQDDDRFFSQQKQVSAHFPFDDDLGGSSVPHHHEEQDAEHDDYFGNHGEQNQSLKHVVDGGDAHGSVNQKNTRGGNNTRGGGGTGGIGDARKGGQFVVEPFEKGSKEKGKGEDKMMKDDEKNTNNNVNFQTFSNFNDITKNSSKHELASLKDLPKIPSISSNTNNKSNNQSIPGNNINSSTDSHQSPGMPPPYPAAVSSQKTHDDDDAMGLMKKTVSRRNTPPPKIVINNGFDNEDPFVAYDNAQAQKKSEADEAKEEFDKLIAEKGQQPLNSAAIFIQRKYKHKKKVEGENSNKNTKDGSENLQPFSKSSGGDKQAALNSVLAASISKNPNSNSGGNTAAKTTENQPEDPPIDINDGNRHEFEKAASLIGMRYKQRKLNLASKDTPNNNNNAMPNPPQLIGSQKEQKKQETATKPAGKEPEPEEEVKLDGPLEEYAAVANKIGAAYKLKKQREKQKKDEEMLKQQQKQQQQQPKQEEEKVVLDGPLEEYAAVANKIGAAYKLKKQREQQKKDEQAVQSQQQKAQPQKNFKIDVNSQDQQSSLQDTPVRIIDGGKPRKQQIVEEHTDKTTENEDQGGEGQKKKPQVQAEFNLSRRFRQQVEFII